MDNDASFQASRKKSPPGKMVVVALLAIHGLFLIIIGLVAFFGGFVGAYEVTNGHATPGAMIAVLGAFVAHRRHPVVRLLRHRVRNLRPSAAGWRVERRTGRVLQQRAHADPDRRGALWPRGP